jgi:hypothetical protein
LNARGQAIGVLSTLAVLPLPLSNGVGDPLARADLHARSQPVHRCAARQRDEAVQGHLLRAIVAG